MALDLDSCECHLLQYEVLKFKIPAGEEPQYYPTPTPTLPQVELTIDVDLHLGYLTNDGYVVGYLRPLLYRQTLRFGLDVFQNPDQARQLIRPILCRLFPVEPNGTDLTLDRFLDHIIPLGLTLGNAVAEAGGKFLALKAELLGAFIERLDVNLDFEMMRTALAESFEAAAERGNFGMVPAEESAVKRMVKRVGVETRDQYSNCVVCLEELEVGSYASQIPCSHTFHGHCIEEWFKHSHYCPVCRFEMPT